MGPGQPGEEKGRSDTVPVLQAAPGLGVGQNLLRNKGPERQAVRGWVVLQTSRWGWGGESNSSLCSVHQEEKEGWRRQELALLVHTL